MQKNKCISADCSADIPKPQNKVFTKAQYLHCHTFILCIILCFQITRKEDSTEIAANSHLQMIFRLDF